MQLPAEMLPESTVQQVSLSVFSFTVLPVLKIRSQLRITGTVKAVIIAGLLKSANEKEKTNMQI